MTAPVAPIVVTGEAPGPGARFSRSAGQGGSALVLIELWQAFGWFGAADWTAEQAAQRWPALTAALTLAIVAGHNAWNYWRARPGEVDIEATLALPDPTPVPAKAPARKRATKATKAGT